MPAQLHATSATKTRWAHTAKKTVFIKQALDIKTQPSQKVLAKAVVKLAWWLETHTEIPMGWDTVNKYKAQHIRLAQVAIQEETNKVQDSITQQEALMVVAVIIRVETRVASEADELKDRQRAKSETSSYSKTLRETKLTTPVRPSNICSQCSKPSSRRPTQRLTTRVSGRSITVPKVLLMRCLMPKMLEWPETQINTTPHNQYNQPLMETITTNSTTTSTTDNTSPSHTECTIKQQAFIKQGMLRSTAEQPKIFKTRIKTRETESKGIESKCAKQPSK